MTVGGFREVDHDLLADFLGGALDGTPEQAMVARLVAEDAAWAEAYARLAPAVSAVRADLARWGEPVDEIPPAVADRITAALAALSADRPDPAMLDAAADADSVPVDPATDSRPAGADPDVPPAATDPAGTDAAPDGDAPDDEPAGVRLVPAQGRSPRRPGVGAPRSEPGAATGPGRRRRWRRVAGPVALAAVSLAAVGLGVNHLARGTDDARTADTALNHPASAPEAASGADPVRTTGPAMHSGTDYTPQSLAAPLATTKAYGVPSPPRMAGAEGGRIPAPDGRDLLARLTDQDALRACLRAIAAEHPAGPLVADLIDYAAFQGEQALVVRFTDGTGTSWAWVSGPECGVPGSGADTRYRTRVG